MYSPFITGVVATWLQAYPEMTPEDAKKIMSVTSRKDSFTGELTTISNTWGYGKIDAYEGVKECIKYESGIDTDVINNLHSIISTDGEIRILYGSEDSDLKIAVYNLQGICLRNLMIDNVCAGEETIIPVSDFTNDIYVLKISGNKTGTIAKKIIVK